MIKESAYLPKQMNGPIVRAVAQAILEEFSLTSNVMNYLGGLSISTAEETESENIGRIIGYLRPLVPEGFDSENIMLLGTLPLIHDPEIGLATINSQTGGRLSSTEQSESNFMALGTYKNMLKKIALIKKRGLTLKSIDEIASTISNDYIIDFDEDQDIQITYTNSIGYKNVWVLSQLFYRFATEPQIKVISGV